MACLKSLRAPPSPSPSPCSTSIISPRLSWLVHVHQHPSSSSTPSSLRTSSSLPSFECPRRHECDNRRWSASDAAHYHHRRRHVGSCWIRGRWAPKRDRGSRWAIQFMMNEKQQRDPRSGTRSRLASLPPARRLPLSLLCGLACMHD